MTITHHIAHRPLLEPSGIDRLREALCSAGYTGAGLASCLGDNAVAALEHGDLTVLLPTMDDHSRLGTLVQLFAVGRAASKSAAAAALAPLHLDQAIDAGLLETGTRGVRGRLQLVPYRQSWILADRPPPRSQPFAADHVVGLSTIPALLSQAIIDQPVATALDLCTGGGVQALHLAGQAGRVAATDLSKRALRFAATTAALAGLDWELLHGDLFSPVAGRRFDLVVANPPFAMKPGGVDYLYRDSGRPADSLGAELAAAAPNLLTDGGYMQYLAGWLHPTGGDWTDRVAGWVAGTGLDAWIIQFDSDDPLTYVRKWSAGHGTSRRAKADWLAWLRTEQVDAIGWGLVTLRQGGRARPRIRIDEVPAGAVGGADVRHWFTPHERAGTTPAARVAD